MGKLASERKHGKAAKARHEAQKMSDEAIRAAKVATCKERGKTRRQAVQTAVAKRAANARNPQAQLAHLDANGLRATKERAKLAKKISS